MLRIRRATERGHFNFGWLDTWHTFSFGDYSDPAHMGFHSLRVINEDQVAANAGFPTHPHRDMEIITIMLAGRLAHRDSLGSVQEIRPGEVQVMTAGSGIRHSEFNPSSDDAAHLLQVWIVPEAKGLTPRYDQRYFPPQPGWQTLASRVGEGLLIHQDARVLRGEVAGELAYELAADRGAWLHVISGEIELQGHHLHAGDGAALEDESILMRGHGQVLLFDLKSVTRAS